MANINKIIKYGLVDYVKQLKNEGMTDGEIARTIAKKYGNQYPELKNISRMSVSRFFEALSREKIKEELQSGSTEDEIVEKIYQEFRTKMLALIKKMEERDKLLDEFLEEAKEKNDIRSFISYLREQRQNIEQLRKNLVSLVQYAERQIKPIIQIDMHKEVKIKNMLLLFSKELCPECRKRVRDKILELDDNVRI
ncbi:MAG: hypothetical protein ACTSU6_01200 [Candidatus Njordarchaeales archaeon]